MKLSHVQRCLQGRIDSLQTIKMHVSQLERLVFSEKNLKPLCCVQLVYEFGNYRVAKAFMRKKMSRKYCQDLLMHGHIFLLKIPCCQQFNLMQSIIIVWQQQKRAISWDMTSACILVFISGFISVHFFVTFEYSHFLYKVLLVLQFWYHLLCSFCREKTLFTLRGWVCPLQAKRAKGPFYLLKQSLKMTKNLLALTRAQSS